MVRRLHLGVRRRVAALGRTVGSLTPLGILTLVALALEAGKRWL